MPKWKAQTDFSDVKPAEGFANYDGPVPPAGLYRVQTKIFNMGANKNGEPMLKILFEIHEPKSSPKNKYNTYAIFYNGNITEQGAPYVHAMLTALGINYRALYSGIVLDSGEDTGNGIKITKFGGKSPIGLECLVTTTRSEWPKESGNWRLDARSFAPLPASDDSDDEDDESDIEDETEDEEFNDEEPEDDEEEEEPEPPKKAVAKKAAKKAPAKAARRLKVETDENDIEQDEDEDDEDEF